MRETVKQLQKELRRLNLLGTTSEGGGITEQWAKELISPALKEAGVFKGDITIHWIKQIGGNIIIKFSDKKEIYICKYSFSKNNKIESKVLNNAKGKINSLKFPTEDIVFSNETYLINYYENAIPLTKLNNDQIASISIQMGFSLSRLHEIKHSNIKEIGSYLDIFKTINNKRVKRIVKTLFDSIDSKVDSKKVLCHGDIKPNNMILGPKKDPKLIKFINLDCAVVDYPELDCSIMISEFESLNERIFFRGYCGNKEEAELLMNRCKSIKFECMALNLIARWYNILHSLSSDDFSGLPDLSYKMCDLSDRIDSEFSNLYEEFNLDFFLKDITDKIKTQ